MASFDEVFGQVKHTWDGLFLSGLQYDKDMALSLFNEYRERELLDHFPLPFIATHVQSTRVMHSFTHDEDGKHLCWNFPADGRNSKPVWWIDLQAEPSGIKLNAFIKLVEST